MQETYKNEIYRNDRPDSYENSGYVLCREGDTFVLFDFSHCSCYGTYEGIDNRWEGTLEQLINMAERIADIDIPERSADPKDYDYQCLCNVYEWVLKNLKPKESDHVQVAEKSI